jgi:hypothetical protein
MKKLFVCLNLIAFFSIIVSGAPARHFAPHVNETKRNFAQQNLIGEVSSIDRRAEKWLSRPMPKRP